MTTKMYSYKRERAKRLYPEPAIFNKPYVSAEASLVSLTELDVNLQWMRQLLRSDRTMYLYSRRCCRLRLHIGQRYRPWCLRQ